MVSICYTVTLLIIASDRSLGGSYNGRGQGGKSSLTASALGTETRREVYLDRLICTISPDRIEVHPARSIIFLPLATLLLGLAAFPVIFFWGEGLSIGLRLLLTLGAIIIVPVSGLGLVYSIAGAHIVVDRHKQSAVLQQGYLGMGVGTQELMPFWKIDRIDVRELTPHDYRGHQDDFAQFEVSILKLSGREIPVGTVTVLRDAADEGLARARDVAEVIAAMVGTSVQVSRNEQPASGGHSQP
jgi:hypothetical protein